MKKLFILSMLVVFTGCNESGKEMKDVEPLLDDNGNTLLYCGESND